MGKKLGLDVTKRMRAVLSLWRWEAAAGRIARRYGIWESTLYRAMGAMGSHRFFDL